MLILKKLERVMDGCPTEWEGETTDGRTVYIRYRGGRLRVYTSHLGGPYHDIDTEPAFEAYVGGPLDGWMSDGEMFEETGITLDA